MDWLIDNWQLIATIILSTIAAVISVLNKLQVKKATKTADKINLYHSERESNWNHAESIRQELLEANKKLSDDLEDRNDDLEDLKNKYYELEQKLQELTLEYRHLHYQYSAISNLFDGKWNGDLYAEIKSLKDNQVH